MKISIGSIEADVADVEKFITGAEKKITTAGPGAVTALAVLLGAASTTLGSVTAAGAQDGLNIQLDETAYKSLQAGWADVKALAAELGITKL